MNTADKRPTPKIIISRSAPPRRGRWWVLALLGLLVGLAGGLAKPIVKEIGLRGGIGPLRVFEPAFAGQKQVNLLLIGSDNVGDGLADTLIVARIDTQRERLGLVSIPRDSRASIPGHGVQKINSAHILGGVKLTLQTLTQLLDVPIDYYVRVNSSGLAKIVDAAGGVEVDVDKRMHYSDRRGGLFIDLQPGVQRLNGQQAVGYVRFRHDARGDLGRIQRQQKFLRALASQITSPLVIPRLPALSQAFLKTVETNLSAADIAYLARLTKRISPEAVPMATLPGEPRMLHGISYLQLDREGVKRTVAQVLYAQPAPIDVVDASGNGHARQAAQILQQAGFNIISLQNAPAQETSRVIDHHGQPQKTEKLLRLLPCARLVRTNDAFSAEDFTVEIGRDFATLTDGNATRPAGTQ